MDLVMGSGQWFVVSGRERAQRGGFLDPNESRIVAFDGKRDQMAISASGLTV
jgi:hypothetical protein